jgi:hypothetical protein
MAWAESDRNEQAVERLPEPDRSTVRAPTSRWLVAHAAAVLMLVAAFLVMGAVLTDADHGPTAAVGFLLPGVVGAENLIHAGHSHLDHRGQEAGADTDPLG